MQVDIFAFARFRTCFACSVPCKKAGHLIGGRKAAKLRLGEGASSLRLALGACFSVNLWLAAGLVGVKQRRAKRSKPAIQWQGSLAVIAIKEPVMQIVEIGAPREPAL